MPTLATPHEQVDVPQDFAEDELRYVRERERIDRVMAVPQPQCFDDEGRLWAAAMFGGVHCYDPDGTLIGRLRTPEAASNIAFGGPKNNRLFITATTTL